MVHPDTYVRPTDKGLGLFAKKSFKKGEIIWIADDLDLKYPLPDYLSFEDNVRSILNRYSYMDFKNRVVIPWDSGKYVNHSCSPNSTGLLEFDNISIALRDIDPDEEIVEDYCCYYGHFETFHCLCGSPHCRGIIGYNNSYDPSLRLRMRDIAGALLSFDQRLLHFSFEENREFLQILSSAQTEYAAEG